MEGISSQCPHAQCLGAKTIHSGRNLGSPTSTGESGSPSFPSPTKDSTNYYTNFDEFDQILKSELHGETEFPHPMRFINHMNEVLTNLKFNPKEWEPYVTLDDNRYTRNLIAHDEKFTVLLLCWNKGQQSPIHDHAGASCWVKMLSGTLREERFTCKAIGDAADLKQVSAREAGAGGVVYINDTMGLHRMVNPNKDEPAVSMHIYSPPFDFCGIYNEADFSHKRACMLAVNAPYEMFFPAQATQILNAPSGPLAQKASAGGATDETACVGKHRAPSDDGQQSRGSNHNKVVEPPLRSTVRGFTHLTAAVDDIIEKAKHDAFAALKDSADSASAQYPKLPQHAVEEAPRNVVLCPTSKPESHRCRSFRSRTAFGNPSTK